MKEERIIAEGAGAAAVAAVLAHGAKPGPAAVIVTGGNIDTDKLKALL